MEHWYCIYTKAKKEDLVCKRLMDISDIEVFNPKLKTKKNNNGKSRHVAEALFPCYIFSRFNPEKNYHMIKYTSGVKRVIGDRAGKPYIVDDSIITLIKSKAEDGFVRIKRPDFTAGTEVNIQDGPLKGLRGIFLEEVTARDRVIILLNAITYQLRVELSKSFVVSV